MILEECEQLFGGDNIGNLGFRQVTPFFVVTRLIANRNLAALLARQRRSEVGANKARTAGDNDHEAAIPDLIASRRHL